MKKQWVSPRILVQKFEADEYVAPCEPIPLDVPRGAGCGAVQEKDIGAGPAANAGQECEGGRQDPVYYWVQGWLT